MTSSPATEPALFLNGMTSNSALTEPLLSPHNISSSSTTTRNTATMKVEWPEKEVPLFLPTEWQTKNKTNFSGEEPPKCAYKYDAEQNLLKLVSLGEGEEEEIIDILDPDDVVGVYVEINMAGSLEAARATTTNGEGGEETNGRPANAPPTDTLSDTQGHAVLTIYSYPREDPNHPVDRGSKIFRWCGLEKINPKPRSQYSRPSNQQDWDAFGNRYAFHRRFKVVAAEDVGPLNHMVKAIRQAAQLPTPEDRGRALVMVNPFAGGQKKAEEIYHNIVSIVLEQAAVEHDLVVTEHAAHAGEIMTQGYKAPNDGDDNETRDISTYSSLICIGGDGIVFECLQGLKQREDGLEVLKKLNVGIIGAGTSNGMAKSIARTSHQQSSPLDASFLIAKGSTRPSDLSVYQTNNQSYWSFLTFSWAMMASIDLDSEAIRFVGPLRFDLWAVWCVLGMKSYKAKFSYLPPPPKDDNTKNDDLPALNEELPADSKWVTEEADLALLWASHVPDAAENTYHCPPSRLDDEIFQILIVRKKDVSRLTMAKILLGLEDGSHVNIPQAEFIQCTAFRLEPENPSINDIDGEKVEAGPIQGKVIPAALKVFCL